MRFTRTFVSAVATLLVSGLLVAGAYAASSVSHPMTMHAKSTLTAEELRVTFDNLFGEHAVLAMNATDAGVTGSKAFAAAARRSTATRSRSRRRSARSTEQRRRPRS